MVNKETVKALLIVKGITPVDWKIDDMAEKVLNYINADGIPDGLLRIFTKLCGDYIQSGSTSIEGTGAVKSISEGDTTITYDVGTTIIKQDAGTFVNSYVNDLNRYRNVYFKETEYKWVFI